MTDAPSQPAPSSAPATAPPPSASQPAPGAATPPPSSAPGDRPAYVPEKFWDGEKKSVKTEDVLKSYTELEKRLNAPRYDIPDDKAPPEAKAAWEKSLAAARGVPEKPEGYGLAPPENYDTAKFGDYDSAMLSEFSQTAHSLGLTPQQAKDLQAWYDTKVMGLTEAQLTAMQTQEQEANARLDGHFSQLFGDQKGVAVEQVKKTMTEAIPDAALREDLAKALPNEALVVIAAIDKHYKKAYGQADENQGDKGGSAGRSADDLRTEAKKLMASPEYRDAMHKGHKDTREKVSQLYKDIGALTDAMRKK